MKSKVIISGLLIVAVILMVGAVVAVPMAQATVSKVASPSAADVSAARWQALGEYYSMRNVSFLSAADVSAARWQALGEYYSMRSASFLSAADVSAARWQALGEYYSMRQSSLP